MIVGETGPEDLFLAGRRSQPGLEPPGVRHVDVLLIHDQAVQLDDRDVGRHRIEPMPHQRVLEELD